MIIRYNGNTAIRCIGKDEIDRIVTWVAWSRLRVRMNTRPEVQLPQNSGLERSCDSGRTLSLTASNANDKDNDHSFSQPSVHRDLTYQENKEASVANDNKR